MCRYAFMAATLVALAARAANAEAPGLGEVHFRFDSSALSWTSRVLLEPVVTYARAHGDVRIVLDAHCDPIGTTPYNVGLAIRRAEAVRGRLMAMGVPGEQIVFAIYGKAGADRPSYAEDRRVTLWATRAPLSDVIARTFNSNGPAVTWETPLTTAQIDAAPQPVATR